MVPLANIHVGNHRSRTKSAYPLPLPLARSSLLLSGTVMAPVVQIAGMHWLVVRAVLETDPVSFFRRARATDDGFTRSHGNRTAEMVFAVAPAQRT